jgi:hypothetical protein
MLETGKRISKTGMVRNHGPMRPSIRDSIRMVKSMERESSCGLMIVPMKENSSKITFTESANIRGKTEESMKGNGKIIRCKAKVYLPGSTAGDMKAVTSMIRKKDLVSLLLEMEESTKGSG